MLKIKILRHKCPCQMIFKDVGSHLNITQVNAEHNHKLKDSKTDLEACSVQTVKDKHFLYLNRRLIL